MMDGEVRWKELGMEVRCAAMEIGMRFNNKCMDDVYFVSSDIELMVYKTFVE